jgi:UrcA family protein
MFNRFTLLAAALCVALAAAPSMATEVEDETALAQVRYADLNLDDPNDAMRMLRRLRQASRDVCDDRSGRMSLGERVYLRKCVKEATDESITELGSEQVRAQFEVRGR